MDRQRWELIKDLFDRLASVPPDEQEKALLALDAGQADLRDDVVRLLAHARPGATAVIDGHAADFLASRSGPEPPTFGRFAIVRRVGAGGMGIVHEAFDPMRGTRVALKALTRVTPATIALFKHEFRSLADLHHPHLVTLYDLFEHDQRWFFTMEFVEGLSLGAHLDGAPDRWAAIRRAVLGLAAGLDALHAARKLHRDLKPSNVMVSREGRVVILDFGLITEADAGEDHATAFAGTPNYMSPEQAFREPLTTASDCYALGVVLFEALTGKRPDDPPTRRTRQDALVVPASPFGSVPDDLAGLCVDLLQLRPADRPTAAQVLERLGISQLSAEALRPRATAAGTHPLVGRDEELRRLDAALLAAASGPVVIGVEGPSGVGKTALAGRFLAAARERPSTMVLESRCYERETISFNVFDSLSDALATRLRGLDRATLERVVPPEADVLGRMFPRLAWLGDLVPPSPPNLDRQQLRRIGSRVFRELLRSLGRLSTLVVFVDDVQWSDLDSAEMLMELLNDPAPPALLLILAFRSEERTRHAIARLLTDLSAAPAILFQPLALPTLDHAAAVAVAGTLLTMRGARASARDDAEQIARESAGNPFFIGELAQFALRVEREASAGFVAEGLTLTSVIRARTQQLPAPAQRLLETVAIAGRPIRSADALAAALEEDRSPTWLALLRTDRFVRTTSNLDGELVEPFHDRLRETVAADLGADDRRRRHQSLALTLERSASADPELLATHFEGAGQRDRAGHYYVSAAEQASAALAFNSAAARYEKALSLVDWPDDHRLDIVRARAEVLANAGRAFEAAQSFASASNDESTASLTSLSRAGYHYAASGRIAEAKQAFASVNAHLGIRIPLEPKLAVPRLLALKAWLAMRRYRFHERRPEAITPLERTKIDACWFVGAGLGLVELVTGALFTTHALRLALRTGDASRIARSLTWEAAIAASQSRSGKKQAPVLFSVCREIVERLQDPYCAAMLSLCEGLADFSHGRWASARARMDHAERLFTRDCIGVSYELATLNGFKLQTCVYAGAYGELRAITPGLLDAARSTSDLYAETFIRGAILPLLHLADDRPDLARASVDAALGGWASPGYHLQHALIDQVRLCIELYDGRPDDAVALMDSQWPLLKRSGLLFNQNLRAKLLELRAKCLVASVYSGSRPVPAAAARGARAAIRRLEKEDEPYFLGSVLTLRSLLARATGQADQAERLMDGSIEAYETSSMRDYSAASAYFLASWRSDRSAMTRASDWMRAEGIRVPERWARMRAPAMAGGGAG